MSEHLNTFLLLFFTAYFLRKVFIRLRLSRAKHPSLRGHAKWSRRIARLLPYFAYPESRYFCSDAAPPAIADRRREGFYALAERLARKSPTALENATLLSQHFSDLQFTSNYRVPFPFRGMLPDAMRLITIADETDGVKIRDIDNDWRIDVSGSYGVNVFGYDFYKQVMDAGFEKVKKLGPVLGPYHPLVLDNVELIRQISGLDEVSFHMSGTEAVMQAVRLARYHTGRSHLVRFCGAYHGWWDGVQPGVGNQRNINDVYTLNDMSEHTLKVLRTRRDIACVLINPLQAFHPNADSASDVSLIAIRETTCFDHEAYVKWLKEVRNICTERRIVLILDEVFTGFRLAYRGAQEYFQVKADIVTYGKTIGGGLPVGVVCGKAELMKRFKPDRPADVSLARGTFNSHPYLMGAMNEFLHRIASSEIQNIYSAAENIWNLRVKKLNSRLQKENLPVRVRNMHSILTINYTQPGRYHWMLQFYLRDAGLELSWVGTGRLIMSLNFTDQDFEEVVERFVLAARAMQEDQWWYRNEKITVKSVKRDMLKGIVGARFPTLAKQLFGTEKLCPAKAAGGSPDIAGG